MNSIHIYDFKKHLLSWPECEKKEPKENIFASVYHLFFFFFLPFIVTVTGAFIVFVPQVVTLVKYKSNT